MFYYYKILFCFFFDHPVYEIISGSSVVPSGIGFPSGYFEGIGDAWGIGYPGCFVGSGVASGPSGYFWCFGLGDVTGSSGYPGGFGDAACPTVLFGLGEATGTRYPGCFVGSGVASGPSGYPGKRLQMLTKILIFTNSGI